jgi:hypothetical protein
MLQLLVFETPARKSESFDSQPAGSCHILSAMVTQIQNMNNNCWDSEQEALDSTLNSTRKFIQQSRQKWRVVNQEDKPAPLHKTWSGKVAFKPLTTKQRNQLKAISKDTLVTYINNGI